MHRMALTFAAVLSLLAVPARADVLSLVAEATSSEFTGDGVQAISLGEVDIGVTIGIASVTALDAESIQLVSLDNPSLVVSMPNAQNYNVMLAPGDYAVDGVYDPTLFTPGIVTALPFTVTAGVTVVVPNQFYSVSGSADVLRPLETIVPVGLIGTLSGGGTALDFSLPPIDILTTFITAVVNWGDGTTSTTVLPVSNGSVDLSADSHNYGVPGAYNVDLSFVLNGSSFTANGTLDVPEPSALSFAPLTLAVLMLARRRRQPGARATSVRALSA